MMRRELRPLFLVLVIPLFVLFSGCADNAGICPGRADGSAVFGLGRVVWPAVVVVGLEV